jgi:hypothetical protein
VKIKFVAVVAEHTESRIIRRNDVCSFYLHRFFCAAFERCISWRKMGGLGEILVDDLRIQSTPGILKNVP